MEEQGKLDMQAEKKMNTVEEYQFEPIKGYPMLHWKGKRPFTSTQFYPAQLKENYGEEVDGWINKIFWGDNLQVMSHLLKTYRGKIDLVCIDPPFDSNVEYKKKIKLKNKQVASDTNSFEEKQYNDLWNNDEYLQFMLERIILIRELLSPKGTIMLHCDHHKVHHLRCILDEVFGQDNFLNEIIWNYSGGRVGKNFFGRKHDNILWYAKTFGQQTFNYNDVRQEYAESTLKRNESANHGSSTRILNYEPNEEGKFPEDVLNISIINPFAKERVDYPTQKPLKLLEDLIKASTLPGDLVFDCFMGSGTTQEVAMMTGRRFIGSDINLGSVEITTKRLLNRKSEISKSRPEVYHTNNEGEKTEIEVFYTGIELYNVNNYDVFRNPVEAKELLKQALEIQPLPNNTIYDGEKDGRMVKIMPVNRIATRADLNELISGFNIKSFEKKYETSPNKPVESLLLVCMGHEADLGASLQKEMHPYKLDVEVVDILRDKSNLEFKRDSEAEIVIEKGKLIVKQFYPMNLLQKLSIMKENVEDWKELTESVKVDFNYDGAVFEPKIIDVPEKEALVKGEYLIPEDAGTIRIKITDLLSESLELTIENK
jgi:site-specific DNA-methyltransferase (adenine-specific)